MKYNISCTGYKDNEQNISSRKSHTEVLSKKTVQKNSQNSHVNVNGNIWLKNFSSTFAYGFLWDVRGAEVVKISVIINLTFHSNTKSFHAFLWLLCGKVWNVSGIK